MTQQEINKTLEFLKQADVHDWSDGPMAYHLLRECIAEVQRLIEENKRLADRPEADQTNAAHPAWWRGHHDTNAMLCQKINEILDGKDNGSGIANEPWEGVRRRLLRLAGRVEELRKQLSDLMEASAYSQSDPDRLFRVHKAIREFSQSTAPDDAGKKE